MNKELKFRVWTGNSMEYNVMVGKFGVFYVNPMTKGDGLDEKDSASLTPFNTIYHKDIPVMQYTGFKDKNGVEIYEGDIVKQKAWDGECTFEVMRDCIIDGEDSEITVIGNIYQKPSEHHTHQWVKTGTYYSEPPIYEYACQCGEIKTEEGKSTLHIPKTIGQAINRLYFTLTEEDKTFIITNDHGKIHHFGGMQLRNDWDLWNTKSELNMDIQRRFGLAHGDDVSGLIFEGLWAKVKGEDINVALNNAAKKYLEHWMLQGVDPLTGTKL